MENFLLFAGTASPRLAAAIARELGAPLGARTIERFPDGEVTVRLEESVRGREVFLVQSTSPPVNEHLMELLAFADACRRAAAGRITAVIPYFGYARADRRRGRREPITSSLVADLLQAAGVQHLVALDLHTPQLEGFFHIPVDNLTAVPVLAEGLRQRLTPGAVLVSPDLGGVGRTSEYAARLGCPVVLVHKRRRSGREVEVMQVIGDAAGRQCALVDDMISTGGTLLESIRALREQGARDDFLVAATHGVLTEGACGKLEEAGVRQILITDSIEHAEAAGERLQVLSVAPLLSSAIRRLLARESLSGLY